jgi:hypothetical protein
MNKKVIGIPTDKILPAGRGLGIEPNLLSGLSGFPDNGGTSEVEKEWEELLPVLLAPGKVSMLMKGDRDRSVSLTSLSVINGKLLLYSGESDGNTHIQAADPVQLREELMASIKGGTSGGDIVLPMSLDALFTLSALSDFTKQQKARNMLGQLNEPAPPTINEIQNLLNEAEKGMDPRWWLTPFLLTIYSPNRKLNASEALEQLQQLELAEENEGIVYPTAAGFSLMEDLAFRRGVIGFHSYYFEEGKPVQSTQVLLGTLDSIWLIECGENSVLSSLNAEAAQQTIEQALAPGEAVPKEYVVQTQAPATETNGSATAENDAGWLCNCGKSNSGNFCISCGKAKVKATPPPKKMFCRNCGSDLKADAQFCVKCGHKI